MLSLSSGVIETMGFQRFGADRALQAEFYSAIVYQTQGIKLVDAKVPKSEGRISGVPYRVALGSGVNEVSHELLAGNYTDDAHSWEKERKCHPPYAIVLVGPTRPHVSREGYVQEYNGALHTYDCFPHARDELDEMSGLVLPRLIMALHGTFVPTRAQPTFIKVDETWFGITADSRVVHDVRIVGSIKGYVSVPIMSNHASVSLLRAGSIAEQLGQGAAHLFHEALQQTDPALRYMSMFLSIEHAVNAAFDSKRFEETALGPSERPARLKASLGRVPAFHRGRKTQLRNKLVWCAIYRWTHLTDDDIGDFMWLKGIRDRLVHAGLTTLPTTALQKAQQFALRIQLPEIDDPTTPI